MTEEETKRTIELLTNKLQILEASIKTYQPTNFVNIPLPEPLNIKVGDIVQNFKHFVQRWENYVIASGLNNKPEETKKAILLTAIGTDVFHMFSNLPLTTEEKSTANSILKAIEKNLTPRVNKRYERAIFNLATQNQNESYDEYFARLRELNKNTQYGELSNDILLDKIICSVKDIGLREKLWLDTDITLSKAIDICRSKENAAKQLGELQSHNMNNIHGNNTSDIVNRIHKHTNSTSHKPKINRTQPKQSVETKCKYCGYLYHKTLRECPARLSLCRKCNKQGHYASVCMSTSTNNNRTSNFKHVKKIDNNTNEQRQLILTLNNNTNLVTAEIDIKRSDNSYINVQSVLDTGATCNIIGLNKLKYIKQTNKIIATPTTTKLQAFGNHIIVPLGKIMLQLKHKNIIYSETFEIVSGDHAPLLSATTCQKMNLIKLCFNIHRKSSESEQTCQEFNSVFDGLGKFKGEVKLELQDFVVPRKQAPRRVPIALHDTLRSILDEMESNSVISKQTEPTPWLNNIVLVKKNNKFRLCIDPRELNKNLKDVRFTSKTLQEVLPSLTNAKIFSTVDAKHGFWQLKLDEASSNLTSFSTPFGNYKFLRMPFGLKPAMELFQIALTDILNGLSGVVNIADDILIFGCGETDEEALIDHNKNLRNLLKRLETENVKLNKEKVSLCMDEVKFYGHVLTRNGIKADDTKTSAIRNIARPNNKEELSRFLGMVTYLSTYIPNLASNSHNLRELTHRSADFKWTQIHEDEFIKLKNTLTTIPTLKYFDPTKPVTIQTDASSFGIGSVIIQDNHPIAYASKTLSSTQKNYAQIEKEMLAIVYACNRFDQYICGKSDVTIETDHSPLVKIFAKPLLEAPKRLQNMILMLQRYNLNIKYKKGKEMYIADELSRAPENITNKEKFYDIYAIENIFETIEQINSIEDLPISDSMIKSITEETQIDPIMINLHELIKNGWPNKKGQLQEPFKPYFGYKELLTIQDGLILKGNRILIPNSLRRMILNKLHISHSGIENTLKLARETVFWPGINDHIKSLIENCQTCIKYSKQQQREPMITHTIPAYPFEIVSMDIFEVSINNRIHRFLITVDHYSDYFEIDELTDMTASCIILICKRNFARHGVPKKVISDNAQFVGHDWKQFSTEWNFQHSTSSPHHQQGNGKAEAAVKIAKRMILKSLDSSEDFYKSLLTWRNTPNKIGSSPAQRIFCRWLRCDIPSLSYEQRIASNVQTSITKSRAYSKKYYDRGTKQLRLLNNGEEVYIKINIKSKHWVPGVIVKSIDARSYIVRVGNNDYVRNSIHIRRLPKQREEYTSRRNPSNPVDDELPTEDTHTRRNNFDQQRPIRKSPRIRNVPDRYKS